MRIVKLAFYLIIVVTLGGCAGVRVSQDYEPGTDFAIYKTFDCAGRKTVFVVDSNRYLPST